MRTTKTSREMRATQKWWTFGAALVCALAVLMGGWYVEAKRAEDGGKKDGAKKDVAPKPPAAQCKKDQDCVAVNDDCCACTQGGRQRAVPRKEKAEWEKGRKKQCEGIMCTEVMSQDPTCSQVPVCDAGVCKLVAPGSKP